MLNLTEIVKEVKYLYTMKSITSVFLTSFLALSAFSQISTNGVYLKDGITTEVEKKVYSITPINKADLVYFSNGLTVKVEPDANFSVNSFFQDVVTTNDFHKAEFGLSSLNTTILTGKVLVSYIGDTNSSCVVSTTVVDIELSRGLFYFEVAEKKVIVAVVDGSLKYYNGKKEVIINAGQAIIAEPSTVGILEDKIGIHTGKVNADSIKKFKDESEDLYKETIIFVRRSGKTEGFTL